MTDIIILLIVAVLMILAARGASKHFKGGGSCCQSSSPVTSVTVKKLDNVTSSLRLTVKGMHCQHCEDRVRKALDSIEGAAVSSINHNAGLVILSCNRPLSQDLLKKVIQAEGYSLVKVESI